MSGRVMLTSHIQRNRSRGYEREQDRNQYKCDIFHALCKSIQSVLYNAEQDINPRISTQPTHPSISSKNSNAFSLASQGTRAHIFQSFLVLTHDSVSYATVVVFTPRSNSTLRNPLATARRLRAVCRSSSMLSSTMSLRCANSLPPAVSGAS